MYDVAIIGAGPAGATAARLLSSRHRVLLIDRRPEAAPHTPSTAEKPRQLRPKLCGGLLAPAAQAELARQGLGVPAHVTSGPQLFAVRTRDREAGLERLYQRHYVNIDRAAFDRWLVSLVPDGVDVRTGWMLADAAWEDAGWTLRCTTGAGTPVSARARILVGADGAGSLVRRLIAGRRPHPAAYVAVQGTFSAGERASYYGAVFDARLTDFYGWTVAKGDVTLAGIAVPRAASAVERYERFVAGLREDGVRLGREIERAAAPLARPMRPSHVLLGSHAAVLLGEAAGLISPSSAEGISYALRSGAALARACDGGIEGSPDRYRDAALPLAFEVSAKILKAAAVSGGVTRSLAMRTGIGSIAEQTTGGFAASLSELLAP